MARGVRDHEAADEPVRAVDAEMIDPRCGSIVAEYRDRDRRRDAGLRVARRSARLAATFDGPAAFTVDLVGARLRPAARHFALPGPPASRPD